jgi:hypothetical protein
MENLQGMGKLCAVVLWNVQKMFAIGKSGRKTAILIPSHQAWKLIKGSDTRNLKVKRDVAFPPPTPLYYPYACEISWVFCVVSYYLTTVFWSMSCLTFSLIFLLLALPS